MEKPQSCPQNTFYLHTPDKIFQRSFAPTEPHPALFCLFSHPESRNQEVSPWRLTQTTFPNPVQFLSLMLGRSRSPAGVRIVSSTHMLRCSVCQRPSIVNSTEHNLFNIEYVAIISDFFFVALSVEETNTLFHFGGTLSSAAWVSLPQKRSRKSVTFTVNHLPWSKWHHTWAPLAQLWGQLYPTTRCASIRLHISNMVQSACSGEGFGQLSHVCHIKADKMYQDVSGLYDTLPRLIQNSEFLDLVDIFQHWFCLPDRKAGRDTPADTPSATWRTSPMKPEKWLGSAKVHSLCPVKFEAQQIFGAFGRPPNGTKFNDKISTRQLESKWPQPDLPIKT